MVAQMEKRNELYDLKKKERAEKKRLQEEQEAQLKREEERKREEKLRSAKVPDNSDYSKWPNAQKKRKELLDKKMKDKELEQKREEDRNLRRQKALKIASVAVKIELNEVIFTSFLGYKYHNCFPHYS
jgi:hypothetical protein